MRSSHLTLALVVTLTLAGCGGATEPGEDLGTAPETETGTAEDDAATSTAEDEAAISRVTYIFDRRFV